MKEIQNSPRNSKLVKMICLIFILVPALADVIALPLGSTDSKSIRSPHGGMVTYSTAVTSDGDYLTFFVSSSAHVVTYVSDVDPNTDLKPSTIIKSGVSCYTGIQSPRIGTVYYILVK